MASTHFVWDPVDDVIVREVDDAGHVIAENTHEPSSNGPIISQYRDSQSYSYHSDGAGNTLALTDEAGDITDSYAYNAFGETSDVSGATENPFQYKGLRGYFLEAVVAQFTVRGDVYDPSDGRWLSPGPSGLLNAIANPYPVIQFVSAIDESPGKGLTAVPGKDVKIPEIPNCDPGCKVTKVTWDFVGKPNVHLYSGGTVEQCYMLVHDPAFGDSYTIRERKLSRLTSFAQGMIRYIVECEKDPCSEIGKESELPCKSKSTEPFGPFRTVATLTKKDGEWKDVKTVKEVPKLMLPCK